MIKEASIDSPAVADLCRRIATGSVPVYIPLEPIAGEPVNECFSIVPEQISSKGGKQLNGWAIWDRNFLIEAEFHAVWISPDGRMIDISPKEFYTPRILFIPDPKREYTGVPIDNIRVPIVEDIDIKRLCHLAGSLFQVRLKTYMSDENTSESRMLKYLRDCRKIEKEMAQLNKRLASRYDS